MSTPPWGEPPEQQPYGAPPPPPGSYQPYGTPPPSPYGPLPPIAPPKQTNPLAVGSLIVSIGSVVFCCGLPGIAGAIMGHVARRQIRQHPDQTGEGLALGGIIVGWVAFVLSVAVVVFYVVLIIGLGVWSDSVDDCYYNDNGTYVCS